MASGIDFGKQIGPLPLGAWIAVVGGGLGIAYFSRRGGGEIEIVEDVSGVDGVGTGPGWTAIIPPSTAPDVDDDDGPAYQTNEQWGQAAITWLIAQGYQAATVNAAITKALNGGQDIGGNKMSIQEWSLWSLALTKMGPPPYPVSVAPPSSVPNPVTPVTPPPTTKPPAPKPTPKPTPKPAPKPTPAKPKIPAYTEVTVKRGDSWSKISARYKKSWKTVWDFNMKYRSAATAKKFKTQGPNLVFAGQKIWVPK